MSAGENLDLHGVVFPLHAFDPERAGRYLQGLNNLESRLEGRLKNLSSTHLFFDWAYELATLPPLLDEVESVLGPNIIADDTSFFCKDPGDGGFAPWHQDGTYSGWWKTPSVSAWIALAPSTRHNGCMRVIPGSHRMGRYEHHEITVRNGLFRRPEQIDVDVDDTQAIDVELAPGEFSLHHSSIIHGSNPSFSGPRRVGFVVRFVTPAFQQRKNPRPAVRVRGSADSGSIPLAEPPAESGENAFHKWREMTSATLR